jgi:hypothetical protein
MNQYLDIRVKAAVRGAYAVLRKGFIPPDGVSEEFERGWRAACQAFADSNAAQALGHLLEEIESAAAKPQTGMHRDVAHRVFQMAENGELAGMTEEQLTELLGPPTWRYPGSIEWDLHPHIWEGRVVLYDTGEVLYSCDQGGAL